MSGSTRSLRAGARSAIGVLVASVAVVGPAAPAHAQDTERITVMSRNLYLGADVGPAMKLLPDLSAAATYMWNQVHATDFALRRVAIAQEVIAADPDVVALQEATVWSCAAHPWSRPRPVYDFVAMLREALAEQGAEYEIAAAGGQEAVNPGFTIGPIPGLTVVRDPAVFQPLFGTDSAACGFRIADVLLVRSGVGVDRVGTSEFESSYSVVPLVMTVHRGYSWADVRVGRAAARIVTTHLESLFDDTGVPTAKVQADQLIEDLRSTTVPLVVAGDFNSDPRDPRRSGAANPGEQPQENAACAPQTGRDPACSAYWTMREAAFQDAGPDAAVAPSWGFGALLDGPDPERVAGMTDRLDYVFTRNGATTVSARLVDDMFPTRIAWKCGDAMCAPSDHAGLVVDLEVPIGITADASIPPAHAPWPVGPGRATVLATVGLTALLLRSRRARRAARSRAAQDPTG